jgi:hypothetical protein
MYESTQRVLLHTRKKIKQQTRFPLGICRQFCQVLNHQPDCGNSFARTIDRPAPFLVNPSTAPRHSHVSHTISQGKPALCRTKNLIMYLPFSLRDVTASYARSQQSVQSISSIKSASRKLQTVQSFLLSLSLSLRVYIHEVHIAV